MRFGHYLRSHLNLKVFLAFAIVIVVGAIVLITAIEFIIPTAFESHMQLMEIALNDPTKTEQALNDDLFSSFRVAVYNAMKFAIPSALAAGIIISIVFSKQFVRPIREMLIASEEISDGNYSARIPLQGNFSPDELDELGRLAIGFNQMTTRLEKNEELRRDLIGDVSHEIRTPLAFIKASIEGLIEGIIPCTDEHLLEIQAEINRLNRLVDDLMELSILEAGEIPLDLQKFHLDKIIQSLVIQLQGKLQEKNIHFISTIEDHLPHITADKDRIKQIMLNIISNAIRFSPENGEIHLDASLYQKRWIKISVSDAGIGIPKSQLKNIFKRFYRVDKSRAKESGGSGIGLTVARQLVEAHGGKIWAESDGLKSGTTIHFTLPLPA